MEAGLSGTRFLKSRRCSPSKERVFRCVYAQEGEDNRVSFHHPHINTPPPQSNGEHTADLWTGQGQFMFSRRERGRLRIGPADGSEWPGGTNSAPTFHMKDLWRSLPSPIIRLDLHRQPAREAEGAETCLQGTLGAVRGKGPLPLPTPKPRHRTRSLCWHPGLQL